MASKDMKHVNAFLAEFVKKLAKEYRDEMDFVLLFGSAARGEFKAGTSDVDLIIQLKHRRSLGKFERYAEKIFWELDTKHGTRLSEVCSTKKGDFFGILEKQVKLYKPFEVLGPNEINWSEGRIETNKLGAFAVIAPINHFAKKLKKEGKVLYGRNITKEIKVTESLVDSLKAILIPFVLSLLATQFTIFLPEKALKYSIKAVLYSVDGQVTLLEASDARRTPFKMKVLRAELGELYSIRLAKEALYVRIHFERAMKEWSYIDKVVFCYQAPIYILYNNLLSITGLMWKNS
jgi:predicted nucleotidyltransferase